MSNCKICQVEIDSTKNQKTCKNGACFKLYQYARKKRTDLDLRTKKRLEERVEQAKKLYHNNLQDMLEEMEEEERMLGWATLMETNTSIKGV